MNQRYTHLTKEERYQIYVYRQAQFSVSLIAQLLNRHPSTIRRR